jgi:hypothetical protein
MGFSNEPDALRQCFSGLWSGRRPGNKAKAESVLGVEIL